MGVLPTPNHLALIRDCYPPHTNSESELPRPVSNAVSKLAFYAVNRPAKLPKVVAALTDRATKATGGTPLSTSTSTSSTAHAQPVKNRVELAVTCEIFRTLVIECAESGNQGSAELVKSALAEPALSVADMALGGGGSVAKSARDANTRTASPTLRRPDAELEARGASLFHAVATMTTPPFFGFGLAARQYQRCLATLSARVQLTGAADRTDSRYVALKALEGAARSDIMFATGSDFDRQVGHVAPALFYTCLASSPSELEARLLLESDSLSPLPSSLRSRKATAISPPSSSSSDNSISSKAPPPISEVAVYSLAHLSRHSTVPQLLVIHSNFLSYLEEHASAPLTRSPDDVASESSSRGGPAAPAIAKTLLAAAPEPHRSPALSWWADRAAESTNPGRTIALLEILRHLLVGLAAPAPAQQKGKSDVTDHRPVSLNASGILNTLAEMLVVRSSLAGSASDPVVHSIYLTLAALVETSDRIGYPSQLNDLASETITLLAALSQADEHEFPVEEVRIERLTAGMDGSTKAKARERLVAVLKMLVKPARAAGVVASAAARIDQQLEEQTPTTLPSTLELRLAVADDSVEASHDSPSSSGGPDLPKQDTVVPPVGAATTTAAAAAAAVNAIPGLALGAPIERESAGVVTAEARAATTQQADEEEGAQSPAQPTFLVHPPSSGHLDSITTTSGGGGGTDADDTGGTTPLSFDHAADAHAHGHSLSPYTVSRSLFLLSDSYPTVQSAYIDFLITFLRQFASRTTEEANKAAETDAFWRKFAVEFHAAAAATATSPAEEKEMMQLAEAAFSIRSGSAVLACLPMLLSQLQTQNAIAQHALVTLARTLHVNIPATTADVVVDAFASAAGVQSATGRDRAQLVETLSTRWVYGSARQAAASSLSPYLTGAPPARSLVQLGISRSRAGSTLRLSSGSASASAAASAPRTPPSLARSGSGGSGHAVPGDAAHAYGPSGGLSKGTPTTRTSLDSSLSPSAYLARRLRQQTPSLADLQAAASVSATSLAHDGASLPGPRNGSPGRQGSVGSSLGASAVLGSSRVGEGQRSTRRTGRESVESLLERMGRRSARRGV